MRAIRLEGAFLCVLVLAGLAWGDPVSGKQEGKETSLAGSRPNIVLIIADDISATDIGCYGNSDVRTPNLDRLASQGQMWSRAYLTATVCSPTRCSIITGRYPHNTGAPELHTALPEGQPMFPRELRNAGYWSAQAGKWHLGSYPREAFDKVVDGRDRNGESGCEYWIPLLRERPKEKPFFLWLASHDAHRTWQPDPDAQPHDPKSITLPAPLVDTPGTREDLAKYYDEVQRLDRFVGHVVEELEAQDILDETLIMFISDNGRPFPRAKRWQTEEGMRTPWIVHWPKGLPNRGRLCAQLVSVIDIAPTFLALAGAQIPEAVQGRSFLPQIADPNAKICDYAFSERNWQVEYCHERALRYGPWSYYRNNAPELAHFGFVNATFPSYRFASYVDLWKKFRSGEPLTAAQQTVFLEPRPREQLFQLEDDPLEVHDLARDRTHQKLLEQLRATMDQWIEQTGDTIPARGRRTPDRHDRLTGKRIFKGSHPGPTKYERPGQAAKATQIRNPGPR